MASVTITTTTTTTTETSWRDQSTTTLTTPSTTTTVTTVYSCTQTISNTLTLPASIVSSCTETISSTVTETPTSSPVIPSQGVSVGKAVGIGFGSAAAGALLCLIIGTVYFWRQRNFRNSRRLPQRAPSVSGTSVLVSSSVSPGYIQEKLPQPTTREDIAKEASRLESTIRNYVDNFTDCQTPSRRQFDESQLDGSRLSEYSQHQIKWGAILLDDSKRYDALRMFIARVLAARVAATGAPLSTLLPAAMLETYQQIVSGRKRDQHMQNVWRSLTADLLSTTYPTSGLPLKSSDPRSGALEDTVAVIMKTLDTFRIKHQGSETREHEMLIELVAKAARLGLRLFTQTAPTELFWSDTGSTGQVSQVSKTIEVFPGVRQWTGAKESRPDIIRKIVT
ncbi:hypothetical protein BJ166DRAFT_530932 [Pestalotiopsis sp. NC0098]|nr:hypothetical protein BJ166DRAFT_530932 [Pestalotiopsis sp. NC0098]